MRNLIRLSLLAGLTFGSLSAATITYSLTNLGTSTLGNPNFRYTYNLTGAPLGVNQELGILFEVSRYASISNGVALPGTGLDLLLLQPGNPIGAAGRYSLLALINNPSMIGTFTVDMAYILAGNAPVPGAQSFFIDQLNAQGGFVSRLETGVTSLSQSQFEIPEPGTILLSAAGLALVALARKRRS